MDLNQDDFDEDDFMNMMQNLALQPREWAMKMVRLVSSIDVRLSHLRSHNSRGPLHQNRMSYLDQNGIFRRVRLLIISRST